MVDLYCESFQRVPKRITLDIDDTFDAVHGGQQLRLVNAHYDEYGFQPIVVFDGEGRFVTAVLRPAKRPGGKGDFAPSCAAYCARSAPTGRRPGSYCAPTVIIAVRRFSTGVGPTVSITSSASRRRRPCAGISGISRPARWPASRTRRTTGKARRFKEFFDGAATWSRVERASSPASKPVRTGPTHASSPPISTPAMPRVLYEDVYCRRGQAENHIKSWKTHLAADRTSCTKATANQLRLFLHAGAYWLMWGLRVSMPKRSMWRVAQFQSTLRLRLIKIAARVVEMKTMIRVHLPTSCPAQDILRLALGRIPRAWSLEQRGVAPGASNHSHQPANILHPALWLVTGDDPPRLQSRKNRNGSRERGDVRRKTVKGCIMAASSSAQRF